MRDSTDAHAVFGDVPSRYGPVNRLAEEIHNGHVPMAHDLGVISGKIL